MTPTNKIDLSELNSRFSLLEEMGSGPHGKVFRAKDKSLGFEVALKVFSSEALSKELVAQLQTTFERMCKVVHPGVCRTYDVVLFHHHRTIASEFIRGTSLDDYVKKHQSLFHTQAMHLIFAISQALSAAHKKGVFHGNLKPSNILLHNGIQSSVTDFGFFPFLSNSPRSKAGPKPFQAPEVSQTRQVTKQSDIYSLGALLYFCLLGKPPPVVADPKQPNPFNQFLGQTSANLSLPLQAILQKSLGPDPEKRYKNLSALRQDLQRIIKKQPISSEESESVSNPINKTVQAEIVHALRAATDSALFKTSVSHLTILCCELFIPELSEDQSLVPTLMQERNQLLMPLLEKRAAFLTSKDHYTVAVFEEADDSILAAREIEAKLERHNRKVSTKRHEIQLRFGINCCTTEKRNIQTFQEIIHQTAAICSLQPTAGIALSSRVRDMLSLYLKSTRFFKRVHLPGETERQNIYILN